MENENIKKEIIDSESKVYDLNLSERYVPNWGAWEVGREIISNAIDADPENYQVEKINSSTLHVWTETCPTVNQIRVLGLGTKTDETGTIGQFGEGFKLAALVACRNEGSLAVITPEFVARYFLEELEGEKVSVLKVRVSVPEAKPVRGCSVWIQMSRIIEAIDGKFLSQKSLGPVEKKDPAKTRFFMKGVFVNQIDRRSIYDWNIDLCPINRDRTIMENVWQKERIANWINANMTKLLADLLIQAPQDAYELETLQMWPERIGNKSRKILQQAVYDFYGTNIVLAGEDSYANSFAASRGKAVIVLSSSLKTLIKKTGSDEGIPTAEDDIPKDSDLISAPIGNECAEEMKELRAVIDILGIPAEIHIFKSLHAKGEYGRAVYDSERKTCRVWLNESLFVPGRRIERLATLCHELAHIKGGKDETMEFENSLDRIAGKLAANLIDSISRRVS